MTISGLMGINWQEVLRCLVGLTEDYPFYFHACMDKKNLNFLNWIIQKIILKNEDIFNTLKQNKAISNYQMSVEKDVLSHTATFRYYSIR